MTPDPKAPLPSYEITACVDFVASKYPVEGGNIRAHIAALTKELETTKQTAAGHYLTWQCTEAGLREQIAALEAENKRLRDECRWAEGALRNAMELLEECKCNRAANQKNAAYVTLHHFLNRIKSALAHPEPQKCGTCMGTKTDPWGEKCEKCNGTGKAGA